MRILFSARPAFGHVFAVAPLASAAQAAGHEVVFASGEAFLPRLEAWGFETRKAGEGIEWGFQQAAARWPELLQPEQVEFGARMFVDVLGAEAFRDVRGIIKEFRPDVVVYEATDLGAGVAAGAAGVPAACHSLSLWIDTFVEAMRAREPVLWTDAGSDPAFDASTGDLFLDIWPPSMQSPAAEEVEHGTLLRPETWADPAADIPAWITDVEGPLVFVSLGTIFWGKELLTKVIAGLSELDADILVLAGVGAKPEDFAVESDRVRLAGFVNQAEVLRHSDVVVHHGGAGTLLGTLAKGLPALVLPAGADRPFTGAALEQSGAALKLDPNGSTADEIADAVTTLLTDDRYRARAEELKAEIQGMPSPTEVVEKLEDLGAGA